MITRLREVRKARGLTLGDVAQRCEPPTTAQTISRLETGRRTLSVDWLNRIATALGVEAKDLVEGDETAGLRVVAILDSGGATAPREGAIIVTPRAGGGKVAVLVNGSVGDYRSGDEIWCDALSPEDFGRALNRDVLVPRSAGRFLFGRLINRDDRKLQILPLEAGGRQQVVPSPPWLGVAVRLVRVF